MGTPAFACPSLAALLRRPDPVVAVVCQPDRPRGRGLALEAPPVKQLALAHGLPVLQPDKVRTPEFHDALAALQPDLIVVAAYGRILPRAILDLPRLGCINVHASLLPRWRGAAPIARSILAGDAVTGITIMAMGEEMDAGDVLLQREATILPEHTTGSLTETLATLGGEALDAALDALREGTLPRTPQPADGVTFAPKMTRPDGRLDFAEPAAALWRRVRACTPDPGAFTTLHGKLLKVLRAAALDEPATAAPGTVLRVTHEAVEVATGTGALALLEVQLEGRKRMGAGAFAAGQRLAAGAVLGT